VSDQQELVLSRRLWSRLEARFAKKDNFQIKFGRWGVARNSIRHSRYVDVITRKEGDGAILRFA
jgi:hypothetical protein